MKNRTSENSWTLLRKLHRTYAGVECALDHRNAFELLAATILSAQCTDVRVNLVTPALFAAYPTPSALSQAGQADVEALVRTTGFFRNKSKALIGMAKALVDHHDGEVPRTLAELTALPGVARKTANVVLGVSFQLAEGVVVDTHVMRLAGRLGLSRAKKPESIERDLMALIPRRYWIRTSHELIHHGRAVCVAQRPRCAICPIKKDCPSVVVAPPVSPRRGRGAGRPS